MIITALFVQMLNFYAYDFLAKRLHSFSHSSNEQLDVLRLMFFSINKYTPRILKHFEVAFYEYEIVFHTGRTHNGNGMRNEGDATLLFIHIPRKLQ